MDGDINKLVNRLDRLGARGAVRSGRRTWAFKALRARRNEIAPRR
jgi:hypothetical protein